MCIVILMAAICITLEIYAIAQKQAKPNRMNEMYKNT